MISLCVIVKNEAQHLARMLESVRDVVAEIIVVDTGSNDGSAAIAEEYGARIFSYEWSNDFADARNFSLRQATHPWILVLDADEQLAAESRSLINTLIQGPPRGLFLNRKHLCPAPSMLAVTPVQPGELGYDCGARAFYATHDIRLFPNDPVLRFAGTVHESIEDSLHSHGYTTDRTDVLIYHYGPLASDDRKTEKSKLYLKLAQLKTEQSPDDWRTWQHLGAEYQSQNRHAEAADSFRRATDLYDKEADPWRGLAVSLLALGKTDEGLDALKHAVTLNPTSTLSWMVLGNAFFDLGLTHEAEHCFQTVLTIDSSNQVATQSLALIQQTKASR